MDNESIHKEYKKLSDKEANWLQKRIDIILDKKPNSIKLLDLIETFLQTRENIDGKGL